MANPLEFKYSTSLLQFPALQKKVSSRGSENVDQNMGLFRQTSLSSRNELLAGKLSKPIPGLLISQLRSLYRAKCGDLSIAVIPDQEIRFLNSCRLYFKNRQFTLKDMNLGRYSARAIAKILATNPPFSLIDISKNTFGDKGVLDICKQLKENISVIHLDISSNDIGPEGSAKILNSLKNHPSLVSLDLTAHEGLHRNRLCGPGAAGVKELLLRNSLITHLNVSNTSLGNTGVSLISEGLRENKTLLSLDVSSNWISEGTETFCEALANSNLQILNLSSNQIGNEGAANFAKFIAGSFDGASFLTHLNLSNNELTIRGLFQLLGAIRGSISLVFLYLDDNDFSKGLSSEFFFFMHGNSVLKRLSMNGCKLDEILPIKEGLSVNTGLTHLSLMRNSIGDTGANNIALGLTKNTNLKFLNLACNRIKSLGGAALANSLRVNSTLESLNLRDNHLGTEAGVLFDEVMRCNTAIIKLVLDGNSVSLKHIKEIKQHLAKNKEHQQRHVVPQLKEEIIELHVESLKHSYIDRNIRRVNKERKKTEKKIMKNNCYYEDVKEIERSKTSTVLEHRGNTKQTYLEISTSLQQIEETIIKIETQFNTETKDLSNKIAVLIHETKQVDKVKNQKLQENKLRKSYNETHISGLLQDIRKEEIAQRSRLNTLDSIKAKLIEKQKTFKEELRGHWHDHSGALNVEKKYLHKK